MPIYRMTKEEVQKRKLLVEEESERLKKYKKIAKSKALIKKALLKELDEVSDLWTLGSKKERQRN